MGRFDRPAGLPGRSRWIAGLRRRGLAARVLAMVGAAVLIAVGLQASATVAAKPDARAARGVRPASPAKTATTATTANTVSLTAYLAPAALQAALRLTPLEGTAAAAATGPDKSGSQAGEAGTFHQIILPDLLIVAPRGLTSQQIVRLHKITGVRNMITFDGGELRTDSKPISVIGVNPATFRSWVPLRTASDQTFWSELSSGDFLAAVSAAQELGLKPGATYQLAGVSTQTVRFGMAATLGLAGVDLLVNPATSHRLGLVRQVAGLLSAPGVSIATLRSKVSQVLGAGGKVEVLRGQLPTAAASTGSRPTSYLQLFKASAANYCPGLSWTVLAAIAQIESGDGANVGPSTAGALGPMQFLPSTWAVWGIDAFGQTGQPNIMNPYDAVPSAARLLCADGAATGGKSLAQAIFDYNHAHWYVTDVLALAAKYAADYQ
ncbi:MAG TPA: lytic transglycosylase domain-containing protein [Streptosporangiaceae bacterium]